MTALTNHNEAGMTRNNQIHEVADHWLMFLIEFGECEQINTVHSIFIDPPKCH